MKFQLGAMTVGEILDRGLKLLFSRLGAFFFIDLIVLAPLILFPLLLLVAVMGLDSVEGSSGTMSPDVIRVLVMMLTMLTLLALIFLQPIGTAAILKIIQGEYLGERIGVGTALSTALGYFLPLLGASILAGLLIVLGCFACLIPGIYAAVIYAFVGQVVVMEGIGGMAALNRSSSLSQGYRWRIFGILLLIGIINFVVSAVLSWGLEQVLPAREYVRTPSGMTSQVSNIRNYAIQQAISGVVGILLGAYGAICTTLVYFDLRVRKEGYDLEVAARGQGHVAESL
jgi:hypothetical protein